MILVAGSANLDFVVRAHHIPAPGETVLGQGFATYPGGKGANQAVACARAGGAVTHMLLALGRDAFSAPLEQSLRDAGVVQHIERMDDQATGTAFICVTDGGENAITVAPGANLGLRPQHLPALEGFHSLLMQLETPLDTVLAYASAARQAGLRVLLNAAPIQPLPPALLQQVDVLVVNQGELASLAGPGGPGGGQTGAAQGAQADSLEAQLARAGVACVIVTLGARGSLAWLRGELITETGFPVNAVDTTGAGDTFCGVLAAALPPGQDALTSSSVGRAMRRANAAAALACTRAGAQSSIPRLAEVDAFLSTHGHPQPSTPTP